MLPHQAFHFVRHGETDWNRQGLFQGRSDIPLNATGEAQAAALAPRLASFGFRSIAASPLLRARRTAEILNVVLGLPIHFHDALKEFDVGPYAGRAHADLADDNWLANWRRGDTVAGVESLADFARRAGQGIAAAVAQDGPVLVVAHGGLVWALEHLLRLPAAPDIRNTALVHFQPPIAATSPWRIEVVTEPA